MTTHLTAQEVTVDGHYVRQRCAWCGAVIVDVDANLIAKPLADVKGDETPAEFVGVWPVARFVRVEGENPKCLSLLDESEQYPDDACMAIDPAVTR